MYKLLLCLRYLRTRYIALASIVSVTLGVATMIVVNSVMAGFSYEMEDRLHNILSDVTFESTSLEGFIDPQWHMDEIRRIAGDDIAAMTPVVHVPAMISFQIRGNWITQEVMLVGIDEETQGLTGDFLRYLQHPANREQLSFALREDGYDTLDHQSKEDASARPEMQTAGWVHRRRVAAYLQAAHEERARQAALEGPGAEAEPVGPADPFRAQQTEEEVFDPSKEQRTGLVLGFALSNYRSADGQDRFLLLPGDDVQLTFPSAGTPPKAVYDEFTIVDLYESKMSEYDAKLVFVPIRKLQELRGMIEPQSGATFVTSIQIKLHPGRSLEDVRDKLRAQFPPELYSVATWQDKQGPLLAAVQMETRILNVLLFLIIAVAGFGILAIFFMIVVEKTRDIGILKALGASGRGIMSIFLGYGLSLGIVGAGAGLVSGLLFTWYINDIAAWLGKLRGADVFDPSVYYFYRIPTRIDPLTVAWIALGAMGIAVLASILPARRAARLHPVEALRYE